MTDDHAADTPPGLALATVHQLPVPVRDTTPTDDGEVCDGEIVEDEHPIYGGLDLTRQRDRAIARRRGYVANVRYVVHIVYVGATNRHTRLTLTVILRHVLYLIGGVKIASRRVLDARTNAFYARQLRSAETAELREEVEKWHDKGEQARKLRHDRKMEKVRSTPDRIKRDLYLGAKILALLLLAGVAEWWATGRFGTVVGPIVAVIDTLHMVVTAVTIAWLPIVLAAPWIGMVALWDLGRRRADIPLALAPPRVRNAQDGAPITPSIVVKALRDLGIPELRKKIDAMEDGGASLLGPITLAGCGVQVDVLLPAGATTTKEVEQRRRRFAENLFRHEHELYITIPPAARTVRLWIADPGELDKPVGPSPIVTDPTMKADMYTGRAPWGEDLRGDTVALSLKQCHLLITGDSNQGKTAALRNLALWLAHDPTVEFRIGDLKGIGDWHMFIGIATVLIEGPSDLDSCAATEMLEWGVREMERRLAGLDADEYPDGVTRELACKPGSGYHPVVFIVDEAQKAYTNPMRDDEGIPYGGKSNKSRYFMAVRKLHNQGRAVNILLWEGTQDPTDQNLPKLAREGAHIRASLVVGTEQQAKMALGDKPVLEGAAPHKLRKGIDKGVLVVAGEGVPLQPGQASITVRTNYINGADATLVAARIKQRRRKSIQSQTTAVLEAPRDLLTDVVELMDGKPRVRSSAVLRWLHEQWPDTYKGWSAQRLAAELRTAMGVKKPIRKGRVDGEEGQQYVSLDEVMDVLDRRSQPDDERDETEDDNDTEEDED